MLEVLLQRKKVEFWCAVVGRGASLHLWGVGWLFPPPQGDQGIQLGQKRKLAPCAFLLRVKKKMWVLH